MSHLLNILGPTTISLNSGKYMQLSYRPFTPKVTVQQIINALRNGGELPKVTRRNVEDEPAKILFIADDPDDFREMVREVEDAFLMAELYQERGLGAPVYVQHQPDGSTDIGRSEILTGRVEFDPGVLDMQWVNRKIEVTIFWTRRWYWELDEQELALSTGGVYTTGGQVVYNHSTTDPEVNWVKFTPEGGVLPAPVRIEIKNLVNDSSRNYTYYINHAVWSDLTTVGHILQGEAVASGGSTVVSATASGGGYRSVTWTGDTSQEVLTWTLSTALLNAMQGNYARMLARFVTITAGIWFKWKVKLEGSVIAETEEVLSTAEAIQDLDTLQLPPYLVGAGDLYPLTLTLCARKAGGGTIGLDFVQIGVLDGFRKLHPRTYGHQYNARLVDDGMLKLVYKDGAATAGKSGHYKGAGEITVWPNRLNTLYFLWTRETGAAAIDRTIQVRIYHRPRVLTF